MDGRPFSVLFLCTGNSARSILAESLLNGRGGRGFVGYSAGSQPKGRVHPIALDLLGAMKLPTAGVRSKSWDEFSGAGAPGLDAVITVCDAAAGETCPIWPGHPLTAHWGIADPASVKGSATQQRAAFRKAFDELDVRIAGLLSLPIGSLDRAGLQERLRAIGRADRGG